MKKIINILLIAVTFTLSGCGTILKNLAEHEKRVVTYPSKIGETVGVIVGVPTTIVLLPATLMISDLIPNSEQKSWFPLYPFVVCSEIGTITFGGVPWLIFGWWGIEKQKEIQLESYSTDMDNHELIQIQNSNNSLKHDARAR